MKSDLVEKAREYAKTDEYSVTRNYIIALCNEIERLRSLNKDVFNRIQDNVDMFEDAERYRWLKTAAWDLPEEVVAPEMEASPSAPQPKRIVESVSKESFFEAQVAELKAEIEALKLAAQAKEEAIELASQEEAAEPLAFNPESAVKPEGFKYGKNRNKNIQDSVYNKLFN